MPTVLIADDDQINHELLSQYVQQLGYTTHTALNGQEVLAQLDSLSPDLIMLDVMMPVMDGIDACKQIRQQASTQHIPIMMIAALGEEDLVERAFEAGADDYIIKPFNRAVLRNRVKRMVEDKLTQDELRYTRDLLNHVLDSAPVFLYVADVDGALSLVNGRPPAMLNLPEQADGSSIFQRLQHHPLLLNDIQKALQGISDARLLQVQDVPMQIWHAPVYDRFGTLLGVMGTGMQLPDAAWQENAALESQRRLQILISNLPGMVYRSHHYPTWDLDFASEGSAELTGYTPGQLIGSREVSFVDLINPTDWQRLQPIIEQAIADKTSFEVTFRITTAAGEEKWVWERGRIVPDRQGHGGSVEGLMIDITEKQRYQDALYDERNLLRTVIDNLPDYIFAKEVDGTYKVSNMSHAKHVGLAHPRDVLGKTDFEFYPAQRAQSFTTDDQSIMKNRRSLNNFEIHTTDEKTNEPKWYSITKVPLVSPQTDQLQGIVGVIRDITQRKDAEANMLAANEQLKELSALKSHFLLTISHELRTPLNSIIGYVDLLLAEVLGDLNEKQQDRLERVMRNGRDLLNLIEDVLDISRLQAGKAEINLKPTQLIDLVTPQLDIFIPEAEAKGVALKSEIANNLPDLLVDRDALTKILNNLLSNALKFTDQGQITIRATVVPAGAVNDLPHVVIVKDWVLIQIEDTGDGISAELQDKIFDEFHQADSSTTRTHGGTGLGLAICRQLTELMGGHIWLQSSLGEGSTFSVLLPPVET